MRWLLIVMLGTMGFAHFTYRPDRDGAEANVGITVVDIDGNPVADASARFKFYTTFDDYYFIESKTDEAGRAVAKGKTRGEVVVGVEKDGFYFTTQDLEYRKISWEEAVSSRKWSKEVVENKVILKPIVSPIRMPLYSVDFKKPPRDDEPVPYDFLAKDWCAPYGKGKINDIDVEFYRAATTNRIAYVGMRLNFSNCVDGLYERSVDEWCDFRYQHVADTNSIYHKSVEVGRLPNHVPDALFRTGHGDKRYYVVRFRTVTNEVGHVVSARYGLISEGLDCMGGLNISVEVNPNENDTNLESDWAVRNMSREKRLRKQRKANNAK